MQEFFDQASGVAIQGYDEDRRVFYWNRASEQLYDYTAEEALGQRIEELILPPSMRERAIKEIEAWLFQGLPPSGGSIELQRRDGSLVKVHSNHVIVRDAEGRPQMYCIDLLAHQKAALPSLFDSNGKEGEGFTGGSFYSFLSHEMRTPLNAIVGFSGLLQDQMAAFPEEVSRRIRAIHLSGKSLVGGFNQMLFLLAWARGDVVPHLKSASLVDIVIDAIRDVKDRADIGGMEIHFIAKDDQTGVLTDATFLKQAVYAILMAALNVTREGGYISVNIERHLSGNEMVVIVSDDGPHIDPVSFCRIFTGTKSHEETSDSDHLGPILYLPVAYRAAAAIKAMFTLEPLPEGGNRSIIAVPIAGE